MRALSVTLPLVALSAVAIAQSRPNVVFILTDDLQAGAIHAFGGSVAATPNIDKLAEGGSVFSNAYNCGGITGALSMPSRAMLITGRTLFEINGDGISIPPSHVTMPEHFADNGYTTFATGKWHSDHASFNRSFRQGESIFFGGMHRYELNGHRNPRLNHYDPSGQYGLETRFTGDKFSSEMYADAAVDFIERAAECDEPYFAYIAFTSPHDPRNNHPDYGERYDYRQMELPANFLPSPRFDNGDLDVRDELIVPAPRTEEDVRREIAFYYGMVSEVDHQIGRIIDALKRTGEWENTIVVFASDNGLAVGRHGLLGKQNLYQHSVKVPLIISGGALDRRASGEREALCYLADIYPTLCDLAGIPIPESVTGLSLSGAMMKGGEGPRGRLLLAYSSLQRSLVKGNMKLILYNVDGKITRELFNIEDDPLEMVNLADRAEYRDTLAAYEEMLARQMREQNDFCTLDNPEWWARGGKIGFEEGISLYIFD